MKRSGRFPVSALAVCLALLSTSPLQAGDRAPGAGNPTVIQRVTVVDGSGAPPQGPVDVLIRDGRIAAISTAPLEVDGAETLAADGKFLVPGLIDAHTHPFPVETTFPQFIRFGVTSILVTGCGRCDDETLRVNREATMRPGAPAPRFFHTSQHFSMVGRHPVKTYPGPRWVDGETIHFIDSVEEIGPLVERVTRQPIVGIKVTIEEGPMPPFVERMPQAFVDEIVAQAHAQGTRVFAHVSDREELRIAQQAGVDHLLHFTGVDIDWARDVPMLETLLARNVHWVTTLMIDKSFIYPLHPAWIAEVHATGLYDEELWRLAATDRSEEELRAFVRDFSGSDDVTFGNPVMQKQFKDLRRLHEMGFRLVAGTDVGNRYIFPGFSLHEELELLEMAGIDAADLLVMATRNGASLLGADDELGTLEVGKRADMLLLDADPTERVRNLRAIETVFRDGQVVWPTP